jgi:hypothetical protein
VAGLNPCRAGPLKTIIDTTDTINRNLTTRRPSTAIDLVIRKEPLMTLGLIRIAPRLVGQGRVIVLGAVVALVCSACASEQTVATMPAGRTASMISANDPTKQVASAPLGYPQVTGGGASLPSESPYSPTGLR